LKETGVSLRYPCACFTIVILATGVVFARSPSAIATRPLTDLDPVSATIGWGQIGIDVSVQGNPLQIGKKIYAHGIGAHANSEIVYDINDQYERFQAWVGVDAEMDTYGKSSVVFQIVADGKDLFNSGLMRNATPARRVDVSVKGVKQLKLIVGDGGDDINGDHADWADAVLTGGPALPEIAAGPPVYHMRAQGISLGFDAHGQIVECALGPKHVRFPVLARTTIGSIHDTGHVRAQTLPGGGLEFTHALAGLQHSAVLIDQFRPTGDSIQWEVSIRSSDTPWTAPIRTKLRWPHPDTARIWMAWSSPLQNTDTDGEGGWQDPLVPQPFTGHRRFYGAPPLSGGGLFGDNLISIPLVSILQPAQDVGLSLVESPAETLLEMDVSTTPDGRVTVARTNRRLGKGQTARFAMSLVAHKADWRGGLRWMTQQYPHYFDPPNLLADQEAGCAAYSGDESPVDVDHLKKMGFRINWKLSDDFPYMGMFIPPVAGPDDRWQRANDEPRPPGKPLWTSCRLLNDYAHYMREHGFYVLSYFNVTEFGRNMNRQPGAVPVSPAKLGLWKSPEDFLDGAMPHSALRPAIGTCYGAWVVDPGDPVHQQDILEQANRNNRMLPDTAGICIDRTDWLRYYNANADDGVSWVNGKPARSLVQSWKSLMNTLGPMMHRDNKVIFSNLMDIRLDLARHLDGVYAEFGNLPTVQNAISVLCVRKPALCWTTNSDHLDDALFQRHLYLGLFPTAPYPYNNHCIQPSPERDRWYLDYGPLFDLLRGRKWVLTARPVMVTDGKALVNLFKTPAGWVMPVVFGGSQARAQVRLRRLAGMGDSIVATAYHPGEERPTTVPVRSDGSYFILDVPLVRGCAMVQILRPAE
jgi:hypothetical protein